MPSVIFDDVSLGGAVRGNMWIAGCSAAVPVWNSWSNLIWSMSQSYWRVHSQTVMRYTFLFFATEVFIGWSDLSIFISSIDSRNGCFYSPPNCIGDGSIHEEEISYFVYRPSSAVQGWRHHSDLTPCLDPSSVFPFRPLPSSPAHSQRAIQLLTIRLSVYRILVMSTYSLFSLWYFGGREDVHIAGPCLWRWLRTTAKPHFEGARCSSFGLRLLASIVAVFWALLLAVGDLRNIANFRRCTRLVVVTDVQCFILGRGRRHDCSGGLYYRRGLEGLWLCGSIFVWQTCGRLFFISFGGLEPYFAPRVFHV